MCHAVFRCACWQDASKHSTRRLTWGALMGVVLLPCTGAPPTACAAAWGGAGSGNRPHSLRLEPSSSASLQ